MEKKLDEAFSRIQVELKRTREGLEDEDNPIDSKMEEEEMVPILDKCQPVNARFSSTCGNIDDEQAGGYMGGRMWWCHGKRNK